MLRKANRQEEMRRFEKGQHVRLNFALRNAMLSDYGASVVVLLG